MGGKQLMWRCGENDSCKWDNSGRWPKSKLITNEKDKSRYVIVGLAHLDKQL